MPQETADALLAGALTVVGLQALVSRETAPAEPAVLTVARFNTGTAAPPPSQSPFLYRAAPLFARPPLSTYL